MNVASRSREITASFIEGNSRNFRLWNIDPRSLCWVAQLVTGQVECHVTGR